MNTNNLGRTVSLMIAIPAVLTAQLARDHDPATLKNWAAPLYWQPTRAQEASSATPLAATANLPLGTNALVFVAMTPCRIAARDFRAPLGRRAWSGAQRAGPFRYNPTPPVRFRPLPKPIRST
jgi:hypothetical protein